MTQSAEERLRALPSVDRILRTPPVLGVLQRYERDVIVRLVQETLGRIRADITAGASAPTLGVIADQVASVAATWEISARPVVNATGVILHTNLGRAPLSVASLDAMRDAAGYSDLELDLTSGRRGERQRFVRWQLGALTGAEAAQVVSNNAAAVTLALAAVARGKEVLVSRGQSVEIGGGFRVPVILRQSGARLVDVGTTNRTRLDDYAEAITSRTAAILHVHSSNFRVVGFAESVALGDLANLAHDRGLLLLADNGSGPLLDTAAFGLSHEPMPAEALAAGADVVAFSGDKLLGGPQSGILVGRAHAIERMSCYPLARAVRLDKISLAGLCATLSAYLRGQALSELPVWRMIAMPPEELASRATRWQAIAADRGLIVELASGESTVGGGSLPGDTLPTTLIVLPPTVSAARLRASSPPVVARTHGGRVLLDLRTVSPEQEEPLLDAVYASANDA